MMLTQNYKMHFDTPALKWTPHHHLLESKCDLDLWPPECNQIINRGMLTVKSY